MTPNASPTPWPTLDGLDVRGKRVLLRVDYNIAPQDDADLARHWRLVATLPTLRRLLEGGARVGILTHRGRPQGRVMPALSTEPLAEALSTALGQKVDFVPDCVGRMAERAMELLAPGQAVMLENVRFHLGEQLNQQRFVQDLARLGDIFVNDAFATAHRAHASTSGLAGAMRVAVLGELMLRELRWVHRAIHNPDRPLLMMLGGGRVNAKMELMQRLMPRVDTMLLGGAIANTFWAGRDVRTGQSAVDYAAINQARDLLTEGGVIGCRIHLPKDAVVAHKEDPSLPVATRPMHALLDADVVSDVGPATLEVWRKLIDEAQTVVWVGSMGVTEHTPFRTGTLEIAKMVAAHRGFCLLGGNGLVKTLQAGGMIEQMPAVSTGAAVLVTALMGQPLPILSVLQARAEGWGGGERRH